MATLPFDIQELTIEEAQFNIPFDLIDTNVSIDEAQIVGQPRAMRALKMALSIHSDGYNIFVSGEVGTGKRSAIELATKMWEHDMSSVRDIAFIHNFHNPDNPIPLTFLPGKARAFSIEMKSFVSSLYNEMSHLMKEEKIESIKIAQLVDPLIKEVAKLYTDKKIRLFLTHIKEDITEHQYLFKNENFTTKDLQSFLRRYTVNVLVDHGSTTTRPLIFEYHPTFSNLFGSLDDIKESQGEHYLPFLALHAGSLLQANGGCIVISAHEMLSVEGLYEALKRFLNTKTLVIQNSSLGRTYSSGVRPLPIELNVKVIMVGSSEAFEEFSAHDAEFLKLFKISAEFDYTMAFDKENIDGTVAYLLRTAKNENLLPLEVSAISEILRYSTLLAESRNELSTQLALLADVLREAHYWAVEEKEDSITHISVLRATEERNYIGSVSESRIQQEITSGEMIITLKGYKTGVVNGLAVLDIGSTTFGTPTVISATVAPGSEGIVNIEHEAGLSGEIHDKGLLILEGYLRKKYARNFPLSIYSGICFEQSYGEIDGDSASSSELYALLSAIGEIPIKQNIAVTGSVNQMGELQPVGGINEKITGFYRVCKALGNVSHPGVIIPYQNKKNLILPYDIIEAIGKKEFHIYPVHTIDQGMSVLAERPSGVRNQKGVFPVDTLNRAIEDRLKILYDISRPQA